MPPPEPASTPVAPTRLTPTRRDRRAQRRGPRRRGPLIGAAAALVVVLLAVVLVVRLTAGGGGAARSGYAGQQLVLERGSVLSALALRRDGAIYLGVSGSGTGSGAVYEITTKGAVRSVAGVGPPPAGATTAPATRTTSPSPIPVSGMAAAQLVLDDPRAVAAAADGTLYVADHDADQVYRITPNGRAYVFAGAADGEDGFTADSGLATKATLNEPAAVALGPDGSVYLAEGTRVRKITKDGLISTVAGAYGRSDVKHLGDGGLATEASLPSPSGLAVAADGSIYVADDYQDTVREISPDGVIRTIAGRSGQGGATGDGGQAAKALLDQPGSLALGSDGSLYIADAGNSKIRRVGREGVITTVAGASSGVSGGLDGTVATEAVLRSLHSVAVDPSGALYATLGLYGTLVRVDPANHVVRTLLAPPTS
jgi:serine/threonine-protein kinase